MLYKTESIQRTSLLSSSSIRFREEQKWNVLCSFYIMTSAYYLTIPHSNSACGRLTESDSTALSDTSSSLAMCVQNMALHISRQYRAAIDVVKTLLGISVLWQVLCFWTFKRAHTMENWIFLVVFLTQAFIFCSLIFCQQSSSGSFIDHNVTNVCYNKYQIHKIRKSHKLVLSSWYVCIFLHSKTYHSLPSPFHPTTGAKQNELFLACQKAHLHLSSYSAYSTFTLTFQRLDCFSKVGSQSK